MAKDEEAFCLNCGGTWFEVVDDTEADTGAAVMVDRTGKVLFRSGALRCYECEEPLALTAMAVSLDQELAKILAE